MAVLTARGRVLERLEQLSRYDAELSIVRQEPLVVGFEQELNARERQAVCAVISPFGYTRDYKKKLPKELATQWQRAESKIRTSGTCQGIGEILEILNARTEEGSEAGERAGVDGEPRCDDSGDSG